MAPIPGLPEFLDARYEPDDKFVPGCIRIVCRFEDDGWPGRVIERGFVFQYLEGRVFLRVYPTLVQYPLGEATSPEDAIELAKQFLNKRLSLDIKYADFQISVNREILRLEEEKRREKERTRKVMSVEEMEELKRRIEKGLERFRKKS